MHLRSDDNSALVVSKCRKLSKVPEGFELHYSQILEKTRATVTDHSAEMGLRHLSANLVFAIWPLIEFHPRRIELLASDGTIPYMIKLLSDPRCYTDYALRPEVQVFQGLMPPYIVTVLHCAAKHSSKIAVVVLDSMVSERVVLGLSLVSRTRNTIKISSKLDLSS